MVAPRKPHTVTSDRALVERLVDSPDPTVRHRARVLLRGEPEARPALRKLRASIADAPRARALLGPYARGRGLDDGPYRKWQGPHWTLHQLALIDYPLGDPALAPLRDRVYDWLLAPAHLEFPHSLSIPGQEDRFRHCASIEGNAIHYSIQLGIDDARTRELAARLCRWQWPDGGWNCDKRPEARCSSAIETLIPLRALALAAKTWVDDESLVRSLRRAVRRAADWFLVRRLHRRLRDGMPIIPEWGGPFERVAHPIAFYDVLLALVVMAELDEIRDPRCAEVLDMLEAKRLPNGFPAERRTATTSATQTSRGTFADWGPFGRRKANDLVTVAALGALRAAGRTGASLTQA